jgi:hypothetical protein
VSLDPASAEGVWALCLEAARAKSIPLGTKLAQGSAVSLVPGSALVLRPASPAVRGLLQDCLGEPETRELLAGVLASHGQRGVHVQLEGAAPAPPALEAKARERRIAAPSPSASAPAPRGAASAESEPPAGRKTTLIQDSAAPGKTDAAARALPAEKAEPAAKVEEGGQPDTRSVGQLFKEEPLLQKALDMFDGEVIP